VRHAGSVTSAGAQPLRVVVLWVLCVGVGDRRVAGEASAGRQTAKSILLGKHLVARNGESRAELGRHMHEPSGDA
jgi:hypothetical protein